MNTKGTKLRGGVGVGGVFEQRRDVDDIVPPAFFIGFELDHTFPNDDSFSANYYIIPYVEYSDRSPMVLDLEYAHPLTRHFDATATFRLDYVLNPPNVLPYDTKFVLGVRWKP